MDDGPDPVVNKAGYDDLINNPAERRECTVEAPWADFQRKYAGRFEYRLKTNNDRDTIWADGVALDPDAVVAVEAKFVEKPKGSLYEGNAPAHMLDLLLEKFDSEMMRYGAVIRYEGNPVGRLRLIVSTSTAASFLGARARRIIGDGVDIDVQVRDGG